jgi:Flp pilus assembly protein TadG
MGWFASVVARLNSGTDRYQGFLVRLRRDRRGATLAMMAAFVIPMIGVVGGAVDISRAYLVKVRLQQACDAGVLAARRAMTGSSITNDTNAKTQATNFFKINLKNGAYGATVVPITVTDVTSNGVATGTVSGSASATVPTTLMKIFGKSTIAMAATCEATLQVANNDVMFVLDVTGSMNCSAADTASTCSNNGGVEKTDARIKALRTAVVDFYDTLAAATTSTAQLRIGIMPYSANVNVGKLLPAAYIADSAPYQTWTANYTNYVTNTLSDTGWDSETYSSSISQTECTKYQANISYPTLNGASTTSGGPDPASKTTVSVSARDWGGTGDTSGTSRTCRRYKRTKVTQSGYQSTGRSFKQATVDTSQFKLGNAVTVANDDDGLMATSLSNANPVQVAASAVGESSSATTWNGCIEERQTVAQATFGTVPADAYDLNIDMLPTSDPATQWKPSWPQLVWYYYSSSNIFQMSNFGADSSPCPKQAMKLAVTTKTGVSNYVNASDFKAVGSTYHDVGLLWGARFLSPTGIFSAENASAPNGLPINRSIVFMTDGDMNPSTTTYGLYGFELLDKRVTAGNFSDQENRHNERFSAICEAIKGMNITLYVVAYAQTMTTRLENCATSGKSFYAADDDDLKAAFQKIAKQIAQLRLSK